jgi:hypothetical protein
MIGGTALLALAFLWELSFLLRGVWPITTFVFTFAITALLLGPAIGAGFYLRGRGAQDAAEGAVFAERRAVLDADATLRRELVRELEQVLRAVGDASRTLSGNEAQAAERAQRLLADVRDDLARPGYSSATWLDTGAGLTSTELVNVRRYDDLVSSETRRLGDLGARLRSDPATASVLAEAAELLAAHVAEREALLGRGKLAPALRPQEMLEAGAVPRRPVDDPVSLRLADAVSYEGGDYVVRGVLDYFGGGRRWRVYQLHDGKQERWLDVRAEGTQLAWLARVADPSVPRADSVTLDGVEYRLTDRGAASVGIESAAGRQDGVLVEYRRLTAGDDVLTDEEWPDGRRVLVGRSVAREDLQLWTKPAASE